MPKKYGKVRARKDISVGSDKKVREKEKDLEEFF